MKFAHEKVIKSKWRAGIAKEDQRPPKPVCGLAARYLHFTFACQQRIIESVGRRSYSNQIKRSERKHQVDCGSNSRVPLEASLKK